MFIVMKMFVIYLCLLSSNPKELAAFIVKIFPKEERIINNYLFDSSHFSRFLHNFCNPFVLSKKRSQSRQIIFLTKHQYIICSIHSYIYPYTCRCIYNINTYIQTQLYIFTQQLSHASSPNMPSCALTNLAIIELISCVIY